MNIFTRKKALLATIANLEEQIRIQARETDELRTANTGLNDLWQDAKKKARQFGEEREALKEELRAKGIEYAAEIGKKNRQIQDLQLTIEGHQFSTDALNHTIDELHDTTSGLASSVSDLKAKLKAKAAKVTQLTRQLEELKAKAKPKTTKQ